MVPWTERELRFEAHRYIGVEKSELASLFFRTWEKYIKKGEQLPLSEEYFDWHYLNNPYGIAMVSLAWLGPELVGALAAVPRHFNWGDESGYTGWQIGDFMVDSSYQGHGIGGRLLDYLTLSKELRKGDDFIYSFPNSRSLPLFLHRGYHLAREIPTLVGMTSGCRMALGMSELFWPRVSVESGPVGIIPQKCMKQLLLATQAQGPAAELPFYNWRYAHRPDAANYIQIGTYYQNSLVGSAIVRPYLGGGKSICVIVDFRATPKGWGGLIGAVIKIARDRELKLLLINSSCMGLTRKLYFYGLVRLPRFLNPRPVLLLVGPRLADGDQDRLARAEFVTSDWQGF